ncbi:hypothetical protein MUK42_02291 [Musa troglodytarum]|uniref:Uncharacterized protein n=1 Tax=Musa troglodytarum TaxID=320322 RepID=A0A9E7ENM7_9LILI|nr:hypothetical protein MUK42_02291 [Musa troglodytarum]
MEWAPGSLTISSTATPFLAKLSLRPAAVGLGKGSRREPPSPVTPSRQPSGGHRIVDAASQVGRVPRRESDDVGARRRRRAACFDGRLRCGDHFEASHAGVVGWRVLLRSVPRVESSSNEASHPCNTRTRTHNDEPFALVFYVRKHGNKKRRRDADVHARTYPNEAVMEVHPDKPSGEAGVVGHRLAHGSAHDGLRGRARLPVETQVEVSRS